MTSSSSTSLFCTKYSDSKHFPHVKRLKVVSASNNIFIPSSISCCVVVCDEKDGVDEFTKEGQEICESIKSVEERAHVGVAKIFKDYDMRCIRFITCLHNKLRKLP